MQDDVTPAGAGPAEHRPLTDLIGLDPDFTGGLSPEEYLRRQRCGECDEALRERDEARAALATVTAERDEARIKLTEAEAVISNAQDALTTDHPVFWVLDDYDGSMDSVKTLTEARDAARRDAEQARAVIDAARAAVADLLGMHPYIREAKPGWFHESTLRLVAAVDALEPLPTATPDPDDDHLSTRGLCPVGAWKDGQGTHSPEWWACGICTHCGADGDEPVAAGGGESSSTTDDGQVTA